MFSYTVQLLKFNPDLPANQKREFLVATVQYYVCLCFWQYIRLILPYNVKNVVSNSITTFLQQCNHSLTFQMTNIA